jgi:hypothetical protein
MALVSREKGAQGSRSACAVEIRPASRRNARASSPCGLGARKRARRNPNHLPVVPVPILCFVVLCAFLGCLGLFALAVTKVVAPDGRGHARGVGGGCAAVLALLLLCGLGIAGLAATVGAIAVGSVADWNPIQRIEIARAPREGAGSHEDRVAHKDRNESAVSARFTVRGDAGGELVELMHDLVDVDLAELGDGLTVQHRTDAGGGEFSVYEFRLPISEKDLERFERDVRVELDGLRLRLPERMDIEFQGAD